MIDQDKTATGETQGGKLRICELLGGKDNPLEVGERFDIRGSTSAYIDEKGIVRWDDNDVMNPVLICDLINDKSRVLRQPRFTDEEVAMLRVLYKAGVRYVAKERDSTRWLTTKPEWRNDLGIFVVLVKGCYQAGVLPDNIFPALRPGQSVALSDIVGNKMAPD